MCKESIDTKDTSKASDEVLCSRSEKKSRGEHGVQKTQTEGLGRKDWLSLESRRL